MLHYWIAESPAEAIDTTFKMNWDYGTLINHYPASKEDLARIGPIHVRLARGAHENAMAIRWNPSHPRKPNSLRNPEPSARNL